MVYRFGPIRSWVQPVFVAGGGALAVGAEPRPDVSASRHRRQIIDLPEQAEILQTLEHTQSKGGAAYAATGKRQPYEILFDRFVAGVAIADHCEFVLEGVRPSQRFVRHEFSIRLMLSGQCVVALAMA